jgi:hypothetical protein
MKRLLKSLLLCVILVLSCFIVRPAHADDFANSPLGRQLIDLGIKFLDDPGDFFFNLHTDNEDVSPLPQNRNASLRFNFLPTTLPFTWANLSVKIKIKNDSSSWPQIDLNGEYGDILALHTVNATNDSGQQIKPSFTDYSIGITASKKMNNQTRLFGGVKFAAINMEVSFSTPVVLGNFSMSSLDFSVSDTSIFTGISQKTGNECYTVAQVSYGCKYNKITSRLMLVYPHLELGLDIFPEGLLVLQPFLAWHWYF